MEMGTKGANARIGDDIVVATKDGDSVQRWGHDDRRRMATTALASKGKGVMALKEGGGVQRRGLLREGGIVIRADHTFLHFFVCFARKQIVNKFSRRGHTTKIYFLPSHVFLPSKEPNSENKKGLFSFSFHRNHSIHTCPYYKRELILIFKLAGGRHGPILLLPGAGAIPAVVLELIRKRWDATKLFFRPMSFFIRRLCFSACD